MNPTARGGCCAGIPLLPPYPYGIIPFIFPSHLDHEVVLLDNSVVGESSHGGDVLDGHVEVSGGRVRVLILLSDLVDLQEGCGGDVGGYQGLHIHMSVIQPAAT